MPAFGVKADLGRNQAQGAFGVFMIFSKNKLLRCDKLAPQGI